MKVPRSGDVFGLRKGVVPPGRFKFRRKPEEVEVDDVEEGSGVGFGRKGPDKRAQKQESGPVEEKRVFISFDVAEAGTKVRSRVLRCCCDS